MEESKRSGPRFGLRMCISSAVRGVFLGCKCENGPPEAGLTRVMADEVERRDDDNGWEDREGRQREWQGDVRRVTIGKALKRSV